MADCTDAVEDIIHLTERWSQFWSSPRGWATPDAAGLLANSRLDLQVELARCLRDWTSREKLTEGHLVLAWANLGALVEGAMMLMCCVFYADYRRDAEEALSEKPSDTLSLDPLRMFFTQHVWIPRQVKRWDPWILKVQQRRNMIHAFKRRELGDWDEFRAYVRQYKEFMQDIDERLPYP